MLPIAIAAKSDPAALTEVPVRSRISPNAGPRKVNVTPITTKLARYTGTGRRTADTLRRAMKMSVSSA